MDLGLRGKVAFVAAASKGLGLAIAEELASEGAELVINARGEEALGKAAHSISKASGREVLALVGDVSNPESVEELTQAAIGQFGRIDILVTNAGGPPSGKFEGLTPEMWVRATELTLLSVVNLCRAVLPGMKER